MPNTRYLFVNKSEVVDSNTGEFFSELTESLLLDKMIGGVIAGHNLYPVLARFIDQARNSNWSLKIHAQEKRNEKVVKGIIYPTHLTYKLRRQEQGKRKQATVKWILFNLELFTDSQDIPAAAKALVHLAASRNISPKYSPGSFGSSLLRASPEWWKGRDPAPWFISEAARDHLPGNYYAIRVGYRSAKHAYYIDQKSSHHTVASQVPLPDPRYLRARGRFRAVENDESPRVYRDLGTLNRHIGVIIARVECDYIPPTQTHLYPKWARERGSHVRWIWTPELRLLDRRVRLIHVSAALTSIKLDPVLLEYADWCLNYLSNSPDSTVKPAMLAAYGMLGVKQAREMTTYSVHGRKKPPRAEVVQLPLLPNVYRSTIQRRRVPSTQNVVARGVIEAEVLVRSIEMARSLESEGRKVLHIYADGIIVETKQLPFLPPEWRTVAALTNVSAPALHSILSNELIRLPGVPNGRRSMHVRQDTPDERQEGEKSSMHLRENEPTPADL